MKIFSNVFSGIGKVFANIEYGLNTEGKRYYQYIIDSILHETQTSLTFVST